MLRGLVDKIALTTVGDGLIAELHGDLAPNPRADGGKLCKVQRPDQSRGTELSMVAGAGIQRYLQLAEAWL